MTPGEFPGVDAPIGDIRKWLELHGWTYDARGWWRLEHKGRVTTTTWGAAIDMQRRRLAATRKSRELGRALTRAQELLDRWVGLTDGDEDETYRAVREQSISFLGPALSPTKTS